MNHFRNLILRFTKFHNHIDFIHLRQKERHFDLTGAVLQFHLKRFCVCSDDAASGGLSANNEMRLSDSGEHGLLANNTFRHCGNVRTLFHVSFHSASLSSKVS